MSATSVISATSATSTHIAPIAMEAIEDPELRTLIAECQKLGVPDERFARILARVPSYAKTMLRALVLSHTQGNVDHRLKEIIRIHLARFAGDRYFAGLRSKRALDAGLDESTIEAGGDYERDQRFTEAEKWALRYADLMYLDASQINAEFYTQMKKHYSEAQIMELGAFIAAHYGMQCFMSTLGN